jgi:chromosome segregation ATPase
MSSKMTPGTNTKPPAKRPCTPAELDAVDKQHAEERAKAKHAEDALKTKGTKTEATKAAAKAKRTAESEAAAKQRLLRTTKQQLEGASARKAECFTKLEEKKADMNAAAQAAEHDGNWTNQCKVKKTISDHADASKRLKTWTDRVVSLQEAINRLSVEQ